MKETTEGVATTDRFYPATARASAAGLASLDFASSLSGVDGWG